MADWEEKLNAILSNPQAMGQIAALAQSLQARPDADPEPGRASPGTDSGGGPGDLPPDRAPETGQPVPGPEPGEDGSNGEGQSPGQAGWQSLAGPENGSDGQAASGLPDGLEALGALGSLDPRLIRTALGLFSEYSATDDRKTALLDALKPFLKPERRAKVDQAVRIARLSRVIRSAFQLLKQDGQEEEGHV